MKKFLSKTLIFIGILSLVLGTLNTFSTNIIYAEDLELVGTNLGLEIIPNDTRLFDLNNLNPGDTKEGILTIKNNYSYTFRLFMNVERVSPVPLEDESDLFKQLSLVVFLDDVEIYLGPMNGFASSSIDLGRFSPGVLKELKATIYLPGPDTGNEFQGETLEIKWIFVAQADQPTPNPDPDPDSRPTRDPEEPVTPTIPEQIDEMEDVDEDIPEDVPEDLPKEDIIEEEIPKAIPLPKTGEVSTILYYGIGTFLIALGFRLNRKKD